MKAFVQHTDYAPTIYDFLGVDWPPGITGDSFWPIITGEADAIREFAVTGHHKQSWTIRTERWSYHMLLKELPKSPAGPDGRDLGKAARFGNMRELYDRQADPAEQNNVIEKYPEVADELELRLRRFMASLEWIEFKRW